MSNKAGKNPFGKDATIEKGEKNRPHGEHAVQERGKTKAMQPKMAGSVTGMKCGGKAGMKRGGKVKPKK